MYYYSELLRFQYMYKISNNYKWITIFIILLDIVIFTNKIIYSSKYGYCNIVIYNAKKNQNIYIFYNKILLIRINYIIASFLISITM